MLKISDLEEKRLIVAYFMARHKKHIGLEKIWIQWCMWWREDFTVDGVALRMYDHKFVKSKTKARQRIAEGETDIQDFKEYDDFLAELYAWFKEIRENYDNTLTREQNIAILKDKLLKYKATCGNNISILFKKSGLKEQGYRLQNQTSKKHPLLLGKYLIFHKDKYGIQECVAQGTYEQMVNWINNKIEVKNEDE